MQSTRPEYDGGGVGDSHLTSATDALGNVTASEYDFRGRAIEITLRDPDDSGGAHPLTTHGERKSGLVQ